MQMHKSVLLIGLILVVISMLPAGVRAATLSFSPASGTQTVGSVVTVGVYVASQDQAMNAASGVVSFPTDKLSVESVSKAGSVFNLWVQEPTFSNATGSVNFEGIVLNPGLTGSGKILNINFRVKSAGSASLSFSSGSVLANDGQGTSILKGLGTAQFTLVQGQAAPPPSSGQKPDSFTILEIKRDDATNPKVAFLFNAVDKTGIDHYEVQIDQGSIDIWKDTGSHIYTTPVLEYGKHTIAAKAFNKDGNSLSASAEFSIQPLDSPTITGDKKGVVSVKGTSKYPNAKVIISLQYENTAPKTYEAITDGKGSFAFVSPDPLQSGTYSVSAQITDARGAKSQPTQKIRIVIQSPEALRMWYLIIGSMLLLILILIFIIILVLNRKKISSWFAGVVSKESKDPKDTEKALYYAFLFLQKEIRKQLALLDSKGENLTEQEKQISENLKEALTISEFITKGVNNIKDIQNPK